MDVASLQVTVRTSLGTPEAPSRAAIEAAQVWALDERAELGHGDFVYSPRELAASYADTERQRSVLVTAHEGDRCAGLIRLQLPDVDNPRLVAADVRLDPAFDAAAILTGMWTVVTDLLAAEERHTIIVWHHSALPGERVGSTGNNINLSPKTGAGAVRRTSVTDWLQARGFELEQGEVACTLDVAEALARAVGLESAGAVASPGYDVVSWVGPTPPELQDAMAAQRARMSTDVPMGEIAMEPEVWDAARVRPRTPRSR